jgi:hypothetical protein
MHCILHEVSKKELHAFAHVGLTILTLRMTAMSSAKNWDRSNCEAVGMHEK